MRSDVAAADIGCRSRLTSTTIWSRIEEHAVPLLAARGAPATFFVAGTSPSSGIPTGGADSSRIVAGGKRPADAVPRSVSGRSTPSPTTRSDDPPGRARGLAARSKAAIGPLEARLAELDPGESAGLTQAELREIASAGFEIGFHTKRHHILPQLDDDDLHRALVEGKRELEDVVGRPVTLIAYPHGKADTRVASAAQAAGYRVGFRASNRAISADADPLLLDRIVPAQWSKAELRASLARALVDAHSRPDTDKPPRRLR